jgi:hypothetical protein
MAGIFISYRRSDSAAAAGRIFDRLARSFPRRQMFMDVDGLQPGVNFPTILKEKIAVCDDFIAVIGPGWLMATDDAGGRRLDNPKDFVRLEIEAALRAKTHLVPALVGGAKMPHAQDLPDTLRPLVELHAVELSHQRFGHDVEVLVKSLLASKKQAQWRALALAVLGILLAACIYVFWPASKYEVLTKEEIKLAMSTAKPIRWEQPDSALYNWLLDVYSMQTAAANDRLEYDNLPFNIANIQMNESEKEPKDGYLIHWFKQCDPEGCRYDLAEFNKPVILGLFRAGTIKSTGVFLNGRPVFLDVDGRIIAWTGEKYEKFRS